MNIGYACVALGVPETSIKSCTLKTLNDDTLTRLIDHNLGSLENLIAYNVKNEIRLFRISSDLIPFGSSSANQLPWGDIFKGRFNKIGETIKREGLRVSMHPGQYTVLNSPQPSVVESAILDLQYHTKVLNLMGLDSSHKIILHIGGIYGEKEVAKERFVHQFKELTPEIKERLVLENDDRSYTVEDVLEIAESTGSPVVFDVFHHQINPASTKKSILDWVDLCGRTWREGDGQQKLHYSQQEPGKRPGSHSLTIGLQEFLDFTNSLQNRAVDIMLEVKDKNLSAIKCSNILSEEKQMKMLEAEWARYKYTVLERSPVSYQAIRELLKDKTSYPVNEFYQLIESALICETDPGKAINAAWHVYGYFKNRADEKERNRFEKGISAYREGRGSLETVKSQLHQMAKKYKVVYLLNSYYFAI